MTEQGDGAHAQPNEGQPLLAEVGDWEDRDHFFENYVQVVLCAVERPLLLYNNNNSDRIDLDNFFNAHYETDDSNSDDGNDHRNAADEIDHNNSHIENDHNYCNYNFADDNQNADSSNDEEEHNEGHQDENALAGAEADYEVNLDAGEVEEDQLPGGFRRQFREEDSEDEESHASKHFRWWDEFEESDESDEDEM